MQETFRPETLLIFFSAIQERVTFDMDELWIFKPLLQLRLMQRLLQIGSELGHTSDRDRLAEASRHELVTILEQSPRTGSCQLGPHLHEVERHRANPEKRRCLLRRWNLPAAIPTGTQSRKWPLRSPKSEAEIAQQAIELARQAHSEPVGYSSHVGYFLIDDGRDLLRKLIGYRSSVLGWLRETIHPSRAFGLPAGYRVRRFCADRCLLLACGRSVSMAIILPLLLVPATGAAIDIVNQLIALLFPPRVLPKLDLSKGIPDDCLTVVAVPTLLLNESQTRQMVEALEVRFLGNRDKNLHFALLTDSVDSRGRPGR